MISDALPRPCRPPVPVPCDDASVGTAGATDPTADRRERATAATWIAYLVAAAVAAASLATPVAYVTSDEAETLPEPLAVDPIPQVLILAGIAVAAAAGRSRRWWGAGLAPALAAVAVGGLVGSLGALMLVDGWDSDAGGHRGPGTTWVVLAAVLAATAIVLNGREHLVRLDPARPRAGWWAAGLLVVPAVVALACLGLGAAGAPLAIVGLGALSGRWGMQRWAGL
jgi:hypothetical protein